MGSTEGHKLMVVFASLLLLTGFVALSPVTMAAYPDAPTGLQATPGNGEVELSWIAPEDDPVDFIDHYVVYQDGVDTGLDPTGTSVTVTGLTNGQEYTFTVAANYLLSGEGDPSEEVSATPVSEITLPSAPLNLRAVAGDEQVALTWSPPSDDGGEAIDHYTVYQDGVELRNVTGTTAVITGLTNEQEYSFAVAANNSAGTGPRSAAITATPASGVSAPSAPTGLAAIPEDGGAYLSWAAPDDGGAEIDYYIVYQNGADIAHPTDTEHTVTGLTDGQTYQFTVAAHNSAGTGPRSAAVSVTLTAVSGAPGAPTNLRVTPGDGQVTLTWTAPEDVGSSPIDHYIVYQDGVDVYHPTSTSVVITGLTNGQEYRFMIAAQNSAGVSSLTSSVRATPSAPAMDQLLPILLLMGLAMVIVAGVLLFVMMRRRSSPRSKVSTQRPVQRPPVQKAPVYPPVAPSAPPAAPPPAPIAPSTPPTPPPAAERPSSSIYRESVLCPRCGRPSSGTTCAFCGKKLRRRE